jgi:phage gp16-like protein
MQGISMSIGMRAKGKRSCENLPIQGLTTNVKKLEREVKERSKTSKNRVNQSPVKGKRVLCCGC